jgi:TIR domain
MAREHPARVFLSYSSTDKSVARDLHRLLSDAGIDVWFDEVALVPGTRWDAELRNAIAKSSMILMLVGERPPGQWQSLELKSVLDRASSDDSLRIVPVLLPGSSIESLPPALRGYQAIDLRDVSDEDSKLKRIAATLVRDPKTGDLAYSEEIGDRLRDAGDLSGALAPYQKALSIAAIPGER